MDRPTHDRLVTLRQTGRVSPRGEKWGGGKTWPASLYFFSRKANHRQGLSAERFIL
jgi:hypothetical protein